MTEASIQRPVESARLEWLGECCIDSLSAQQDQLLKAIEEGMPVEVDLSGVSRIDTAGLQLLLTFVLDMQRRGQRVTLTAASEAVRESAKTAGMLELLGM